MKIVLFSTSHRYVFRINVIEILNLYNQSIIYVAIITRSANLLFFRWLLQFFLNLKAKLAAIRSDISSIRFGHTFRRNIHVSLSLSRNSKIRDTRSVVSAAGYLGAFTTSANTHFSGGSIRRYASNKRLIARDSSSQQSL